MHSERLQPDILPWLNETTPPGSDNYRIHPEYVGCSVEYLRSHLETQFEKESERCGHSISWENQGDWHIDHIKPCDSFDLDLEDERHKCFHYTNLQPMWAPDNLSKSNIYDEYEDEREWNGDKWI